MTKKKVIIGNHRDNVFEPIDGQNIIYGRGGDDVIRDTNGRVGDIYFGGPGDDLIFTHGGHDRIYGGDGRDKVVASGSDNIVVDGGKGRDYFEYEPPPNLVATFTFQSKEDLTVRVHDKWGMLVEKVVATDFEDSNWF